MLLVEMKIDKTKNVFGKQMSDIDQTSGNSSMLLVSSSDKDTRMLTQPLLIIIRN